MQVSTFYYKVFLKIYVRVVVCMDWKCLHVTELFQSLLYTLNLAWKEAIEQKYQNCTHSQIISNSTHFFYLEVHDKKCP